MKPVIIISLFFLSLLSLPALAQEKQVVVPYTLADRDRAIHTETRMEMNFDKRQSLSKTGWNLHCIDRSNILKMNLV